MILICPNCGNRYLIGDHALGEDGRNVRCGNCEHTWHAMPESEDTVAESRAAYEETEPIPEAVRPVPEHSSLPAVQDGYLAILTRSPKINGVIAACLIFLVIAMPVMISPAAAVNAWPASAWFYQTLGISVDLHGDDLALERVRATYKQNNQSNGGELSIEGRIINLADHAERFHRLAGKLKRQGDARATARRFTIGTGILSGEAQESFSHTMNVELSRDAELQVGIMPPWQE